MESEIIDIETTSYNSEDLTKSEWLEALEIYHKQYKEIFGYIPCIDDFSCTRTEYNIALLKAIKEQKEITEYLK